MGKTKIEWTEFTWNPIRARYVEIQDDGSGKERIGWHCEHVNEACRNCYAETLNKRLGTGFAFGRPDRDRLEIFLDEKLLTAPLHWKKPRKIFLSSMTDIFAEFVTDEMLDKLFAVMALAKQHTFQVLTKRPERMRNYLAPCTLPDRIDHAMNAIAPVHWCDRELEDDLPLPNVWLGVSVHDQESADAFIPLLLATPATKRFISYEPALGPIDLRNLREGTFDALSGRDFEAIGDIRDPGFLDKTPKLRGLDWVIGGGESGPHARPSHPEWFRAVRDQCRAMGVAYFHKQNGEWAIDQLDERPAEWVSIDPEIGEHDCAFDFSAAVQMQRVGKKRAGRLLDGVEHNEFPI